MITSFSILENIGFAPQIEMLLFLILPVFSRTLLLLPDGLGPNLPGYSALLTSLPPDTVAVPLSSPHTKLFDFGVPLFDSVVVADGSVFGAIEERSNAFRPYQAEMLYSKNMQIARAKSGVSLWSLVDLVDNGGNVVLLTDTLNDDIKTLVEQFGMSITNVKGPERFARHSYAPIVSGTLNESVALNGRIAFQENNHLVFPVIADLVGALQARNGGRFLLVPSFNAFSDEQVLKHPANEQLLKELINWGIGAKAVLRTRDLKHHKTGETEKPYMYREKDEINFSIVFEERKNDLWVPYKANDIQLDFTMLDPHVRMNLKPLDDKGTYGLTFKSPDVYGIFKFVIDYKRKGYTHVHVEEVAPVRNFKHNDYERFIFGAYPYYSSAFSSALGVVLFSSLFLFSKEASKKLD